MCSVGGPPGTWLGTTGLFYQCPYYVSGSGNISVALLSMQGQKALGFHKKYLCSIKAICVSWECVWVTP